MSKALKIKPLGHRVLVEPQEIETKTSGGLVIPPSANDDKKPAYGKIVMLGVGKDSKGKDYTFDVKVGDTVYFQKYSPTELEVDGNEYLVLDHSDILAILN